MIHINGAGGDLKGRRNVLLARCALQSSAAARATADSTLMVRWWRRGIEAISKLQPSLVFLFVASNGTKCRDAS